MSAALKILFAENHPDLAQMFAFILRARGHAVTAVESVDAARQALGSPDFDLFVCDYSLGDGTAIDLIQWLRGTGSRMKSICVSGFGYDVAEKCRRAGFDGFLTKPVQVDLLESTAESLGLGSRQKPVL